MKTDLKKAKTDNEAIIDQYDYLANAASAQDCTGLIPANPKPGDMMDAYDYVVVNDRVDHAVENVQAIVKSEHCKRERVASEYKKILEVSQS